MKTIKVKWLKTWRGRGKDEIRDEPDCPQIPSLVAQGFCELVKPAKPEKPEKKSWTKKEKK